MVAMERPRSLPGLLAYGARKTGNVFANATRSGG